MLNDGMQVEYQGQPLVSGITTGDQGTVLVTDGAAAHVSWVTGSRAGQVDLIENQDLVRVSVHDKDLNRHLVDSLDFVEPEQNRVVATYDEQGVDGLVDLLVNEGALTDLAQIGDDAVSQIMASVHHHAAVGSLLSGLDEDVRAQVVRHVARQVMSEAAEGLGEVDE